MVEKAPLAASELFLTVEVGRDRFALPAADVAEVIRPPALTRVPLSPPSLLGVANLRGAVMPVVSLHGLLGDETNPSARTRVVVLNRSTPIGLVIDRVASLEQDAGADASRLADGERTTERQIDLDALLSRNFGHFEKRAQLPRVSDNSNSEAGEDARGDEIPFVCFSVAGQDFALPLSYVEEIVTIPAGVAAVPQADGVMLGVMALRGRLLPLASLGGLLRLRSGGNGFDKSKALVVRIGEALVGLVADGMKEILRIRTGEIDPVPALLSRGEAEARIQGICRLEGGRRLVSVLAAESLFRDQVWAEHVAPHIEKSSALSIDNASNDDEQFIVFRLGDEEYGLPIASVDEIVRVPETLSRLPKAPAFIEGVMNLRGRVVPVIDQRRRFKVSGNGQKRRERVIVVTIDRMQAGFVVDHVSEVLKIPQTQLRATPDLATDGSQVIDRIANIDAERRMILLLDPRELLDRAEKDLLAAMGGDHPDRPAS
ncbi:chemotaxis protein CheW [Microvirga lotononidis]|uniref:Chemotaxis protein CheW n=1 Tax=Microvirga lotononidis TaxID=864069 RepID=I4YYB4_9HYPH|nr:chemotaxis protein CheW [Microvirga lotononidis]EIM28956.1 chemotaxis signal transduction protein [Microvirga lotononidis]WQO26874.1 chemotaxis protein CheW [Microvirga lotononidis]